MPSALLSRPRTGRTQSAALLALLLVVTLLVTGVLAFEGQQASRDHQAAVEKMLRDNAAVAARDYAQQVDLTAISYFRLFFMKHVTEPDLGNVVFPALSFPEGLSRQCDCRPLHNVENEFVYDFRSDSLVMKKGSLSAGDHGRLVALLKEHPLEKLRSGWQMGLAAERRGPGNSVVAFVVRHDAPENPRDESASRLFAFGFLARPEFLVDLLTPVDDFNAMMPSGDRDTARNRFAVAVYSRDELLFEKGAKSGYYADHAVQPAFGDMKVRVHIDQKAVPIMSGGAFPESRLPVVVGLMLLTSILIGSALILTRRQNELAAAREDFVSSVSHELRTPLAQIRMFTETLLLGRVRNDTERRRSLEIIDQEARRLTALVENVLHLSRAERGTARLAPAATQLGPTVREMIETFAQLPRSRNVEFRSEVEDRLVATVDPGAFRQILLNLLDNAVKYGPAGQRVSVGLAMFAENARVWVDDQGPGIPVRERDRVFEPFYRTTSHLDSIVAGSGIGLAVVRELAGLLGGRAWAEGAPGGGARVVVEFPDAYLRAEEATGSWAVA